VARKEPRRRERRDSREPKALLLALAQGQRRRGGSLVLSRTRPHADTHTRAPSFPRLLLPLPPLLPPCAEQESEEVDMKPIVVMDVATFLYIKTNNLYSTRAFLSLSRYIALHSHHAALP
jgi:hypothetical protein